LLLFSQLPTIRAILVPPVWTLHCTLRIFKSDKTIGAAFGAAGHTLHSISGRLATGSEVLLKVLDDPRICHKYYQECNGIPTHKIEFLGFG